MPAGMAQRAAPRCRSRLAGELPSSWLSTMGVVSCANRELPGPSEERDCLACANERSFSEGRCWSSQRQGPVRGSR
jgi:hypothetical protein